MDNLALDAHTHCGLTVPFEELSQEWAHGAIQGGVVFSPVEEIYDRYDPYFTDSDGYRRSRRRVHDYLLKLGVGKEYFPLFLHMERFCADSGSFFRHKVASSPWRACVLV